MDPQPPFAPYPNQRIGPALDVSSGGSMDWAGMSASGKYAIVSYNGDYPRVFDVNTSTLALTPPPMSTSYQCHGSAADGHIHPRRPALRPGTKCLQRVPPLRAARVPVAGRAAHHLREQLGRSLHDVRLEIGHQGLRDRCARALASIIT